ncbi:MCE family protein [Amycolatopsis nigrescens]|uniref:MCE family protein n=1 Tax=Amycolatopsis nigrescens TaxID=381445 RepID=UPI00036BDF94|nr:MCE family protein [Amycolatopsis nigrescens]
MSRYHLLGVAFLGVLAAFFALTIAFYDKAFTSSVPVSVQTDRIGNQLRVGADVKVRDVLVGRVAGISSDGERATLSVELRPESAGSIPANVSARFLPKTLFGERFVSLEVPEQPSAETLAAGAVIGQDRSRNAVETEQVLNDLMPVLEAVQPEKLAATLNAVSTALEGRGRSLGETVGLLDDYLRELMPSLPDLTAVIESAAPVAQTYDHAGPDLLAALGDLTGTSRTVVAQRENLRSLYSSVSTTSAELTSFLAANKENLIQLVSSGRPTAELLARYSPEYPCLLRQIADTLPTAEAVTGKGTDHPGIVAFTAEITAARGQYLPGLDTPRYEDRRGPRCYELPAPGTKSPPYPADGPFKDGSAKPAVKPSGGGGGGGASLANSPAEKDLIATLLAPQLGVMPADVPGWSSLLVGPLYRGAEVTLK